MIAGNSDLELLDLIHVEIKRRDAFWDLFFRSIVHTNVRPKIGCWRSCFDDFVCYELENDIRYME